MKKKNPWIKVAVTYTIITVAYIALTCFYAISGNKQSTVIYAILTPVWGAFLGIWFHKAISYRSYKFYFDGYYEQVHTNMELRKELIKLSEGKENDGQNLT